MTQQMTIYDKHNRSLIIEHRKAAVFFLREGNPKNVHQYRNYRGEENVAWHKDEVIVKYDFTTEQFTELFWCLTKIAHETFVNFTPKEANSIASDYTEYYDKELDNNGGCGIGVNSISFDAPYHYFIPNQPIRLYKFNKRKFEALLFDFEKKVKEQS